MENVFQWGVTVVVSIFGGGAVWGYWKDRRADKAKGKVAEATVELQVDAARMENLEKRFKFAEKAWDEERKSLERQIERLEHELGDMRAELTALKNTQS